MKRYVVGLAVSAMTLAWLPGVAAHSLEDFEEALREDERYVEIVDRQVPDFVLRDAEGVQVGMSDLRGRVTVLNFIYATCPDVCPLQSEIIAETQDVINGTPLHDQVQFVSITTDPLNDTPEAMKEYGADHGLDPANWVFLTSGETSSTQALLSQFGLKFEAVDDGYQVHAVVTHVIDKEGRLRAKYHGLRFDVDNLVRQLGELAKDNDLHLAGAGPFGAPNPNQSTSGIALWMVIAASVLGLSAIGAGGTFYARRRTRA